MKILPFYIYLILIAGLILFLSGCDNEQTKRETLIIFHAGSLSKPFKEIKEAFEKKHPRIRVLTEAAGSVECARKITELGKPCDIFASSDYAVIKEMLIPDHAGWYISFAGNEMCLAFTENSRLQNKITDENWFRILLNDSVAFGRSNPNLDPCGYRTILFFELAEQYYHQPGLKEKLSQKDKKYIRPKEVDLLALLESNAIDYIFIYKSVAVQHHLKIVEFHDSINLGNPLLDDHYAQVSVIISGNNPGETLVKKGESMVYAFTIPVNSSNPELAVSFSEFLLNQSGGQKIMEKNGQKFFIHADENYVNNIPEQLKQFIKTKTNENNFNP